MPWMTITIHGKSKQDKQKNQQKSTKIRIQKQYFSLRNNEGTAITWSELGFLSLSAFSPSIATSDAEQRTGYKL